MGLFKKKPPKVFEARLPDQEVFGELNPGSATWAFVVSWAKEEIRKARESNDSLSKGLVETSVIRGRIKALKELLNLPKGKDPSRFKGLLSEDYPDSDRYAGYE